MDRVSKYVEKADGGKIKCTLCPRYCALSDGQRGLCFVRGRRGDDIVLHTYGRSSGFCIDPIEKKPLNHFLPGTPTLSFGTAGCNLTCQFCQNWDISKSKEMDRLQSSAMPEDIVAMAKSTGCRSLAYTYNDPIIFLEYAKDVALEAKRFDIKSVAVTAGYMTPKAREEFFSFIDATNVDLKGFDPKFYQKTCGAELEVVLETLCYIHHHTNVWLELTTLLIPGQNDSEAELNKLCGWVAENLGLFTPIHFTSFHPDYKMTHLESTPTSTLLRAYSIAKSYGLKFVYTGNVHHESTSSTYCHHCGECLIARDWFNLKSWNLVDSGKCKFCGTQCPGVFEDDCGNWGDKRQPLEISNLF
ncbi:MAG: AmmeMemoRadiSam system radical SAM enzyme [Bacteriovoracaceae bacterium]|nr:AmmeMemoRadiSam system radical SAM enzyme [Bacteriovoracaceae bacterium]